MYIYEKVKILKYLSQIVEIIESKKCNGNIDPLFGLKRFFS